MKYRSANLSLSMDTRGENVECCSPRSVKMCMGWWPWLQCRGKCLCSHWRCWIWHREHRVGLSGVRQLLCGCTPLHPLCSEQPVSPALSPSYPLRYLHLPLSNHFFLWLLKLTHLDILRGEKWEVLLEIALMCCAGEALFEEQAMRVLPELYFYLPLNNISLFYFKQNLMWVYQPQKKKNHKNTLLKFGCSLFPVMKGRPV